MSRAKLNEVAGRSEGMRNIDRTRMTMSGFCAFPAPGSHGYCHERLVPTGHPCTCDCHNQEVPPTMEGFGTVALAEPPEVAVNAPVPARSKSARTKRVEPEQKPAATVTLDLPILFYDDYVHRGLLAGRVVKRLARNTRVELDRAGYEFLLADADRHVNGSAKDGADPNVVISARATLAALNKVGRP